MEEYNIILGKQSHDGDEFCCRTVRVDPFESDCCVPVALVRFPFCSAHAFSVCKLLILHICHTGFSLPLPAYSTTELCSEKFVQKNCHLLTLNCLPVPRHPICMQLLELLWLLNFAIGKSKTNHSILHCHSTIAKIILEQRSIVKTHFLLPQ